MLAARELDGDRTHQQLFQPGTEAGFPRANDDYRYVRLFGQLAHRPGRILGQCQKRPTDPSSAQDLLKRFPDAGTSGFNVVNDPVGRQAACFQPCRPSHQRDKW